jgi:tetratricopeptide (TPR) repeat protein
MKFLVPFFTRLYQYATVFLIVGSPLFFIPGTGFTPEVTYYIVMMALAAVALLSYVIVALTTRSWHSVSKLEFISYFAFSISVLLSVAFATNQRTSLFGNAFDSFSGVSLLVLPVIVYLVRTLPDGLRTKMKYILAIILSASTFVLMLIMMMNGKFIDVVKQVFLGFSNAVSFSAYIGIFVVGAFFFAKKAKLKARYKVVVITASLVFLAWVISIASTDSIRPNLTTSLQVGKSVMVTDGLFGIGAGDYVRAWQLYRPQSVIASPYFGYDFTQGFSTTTTLFATIGIIGLIAFLMLTLSALYSTYRSYRLAQDEQDHFVTGFLAIALLYLSIVSWVIPLSFAMLVVWMVVAGLGLAKARLSEFHPSKKLGLLMVPLALILLVNIGILTQKVRAFTLFGKAQNMLTQSGPTEDVGALLSKAEAIYPYDGFYRAQVEYFIAYERSLVAQTTGDQTTLQNTYLEKAQAAVNAGLAAVKIDGTNYQNYVSLGRAYELAIPFEKEGGFDHAKESYEQAVKLYPNNPYLYVMLARLEASAGTKEGVRTQLTEALKKKQNFADALYLMSQLEASDQKMDEALTYAIEAVKNAPNDPLVYVQAGLLYYGKKDYPNAASALNTALEKDPNNATIAYFLALTLRDGGRPDLAKALADELVKRDPTNADLKALAASVQTAATSTKAAPTGTKK